MYCVKCGKELKEGYVGTVCEECQGIQNEKEIPAEVKNSLYSVNKVNYRMFGFGKALTSTILSVFGYLFSLMGYIFALAVLTVNGVGNVEGTPDAAVVLIIMSLPLIIIGLIFGIQSINNFKYCKNRNYPKPIPTLILGISGVVFSALSLIFILLSLFFIALV